jgi:hypothetical protein
MILMGVETLGRMWLKKAAVRARLADQPGEDQAFHDAKVATARFYAARELVKTSALRGQIEAGADALMALPVEAF